MMIRRISGLIILSVLMAAAGCQPAERNTGHLRPLADTTGFAHCDWQMDSIMARIDQYAALGRVRCPGV